MTPEKLTVVERAVLSNQFKILARLDAENRSYYELRAEIAENGYEGLYYELFEHIYEGVSQEVCTETFEILTMFRVIINTIASLTDEQKEELNLEELQFTGFDANNDDHYGFMEFLIEKEGRYAELKGMYRNSHDVFTIRRYRKMLSAYRNKSTPYGLDFNDLKAINESIK